MIAILDDPDRTLEWNGTPAGPDAEIQVREWAFGIFARWGTNRQIKDLVDVGAEEAADILGMASEEDKQSLLSGLPIDFRSRVQALLPVPSM